MSEQRQVPEGIGVPSADLVGARPHDEATGNQPVRIEDSPVRLLNPYGGKGFTVPVVGNIGGGEMVNEMTITKLPLCACGCGRQVKSPGRKLYSRQCIGRYNAGAKTGVPRRATSTPVLLERLISLVREVPRESRSSFLAQVVEVVNAEEDLQENNEEE